MRKDHPGVYIPPPLIYVAFFFFSVLLQKRWPLSSKLFSTARAPVIGWLLIALGGLVSFPALQRFLVSKNTLITVKPAHSLQTTGIYAHTRNPMYMGLLLLYSGIAFFQGNWWTFIVAPLRAPSGGWQKKTRRPWSRRRPRSWSTAIAHHSKAG